MPAYSCRFSYKVLTTNHEKHNSVQTNDASVIKTIDSRILNINYKVTKFTVPKFVIFDFD